MLAKRSYFAISICVSLFAILVGNTSLPVVLASNSYQEKSEKLRAELSRFRSALMPNERYEICLRINAALLDVLQERASQDAKFQDVIGKTDGFILSLGSWITFGENRYRLVVLTPKEYSMGAITSVYVQPQSEQNLTEQVHTLTQGANIGQLAYYDILSSGGDCFVTLVEKRYGPEDKSVRIYMLKFADGRWQVYNHPPVVFPSPRWTIRSDNRCFSLSHRTMDWRSEYNYEVSPTQKGIEISIVDRAGISICGISVRFANGEWILSD